MDINLQNIWTRWKYTFSLSYPNLNWNNLIRNTFGSNWRRNVHGFVGPRKQAIIGFWCVFLRWICYNISVMLIIIRWLRVSTCSSSWLIIDSFMNETGGVSISWGAYTWRQRTRGNVIQQSIKLNKAGGNKSKRQSQEGFRQRQAWTTASSIFFEGRKTSRMARDGMEKASGCMRQ